MVCHLSKLAVILIGMFIITHSTFVLEILSDDTRLMVKLSISIRDMLIYL
jgi:hypothetical protein